MSAQRRRVTDYTPDPANANRGTERGLFMLEESLQKTGAGRSIVVDRNGIIIAGNKTQQAALDNGIIEAIEVETDGNQLVVVKRRDLDLSSGDERARLLAYYDNRASQVGLEWDAEQLLADMEAGIDLSSMFSTDELADILSDLWEPFEEVPAAQPNPRNLPIDVIYTLQMADCTCCLAVQAGLKYGIQSGQYRLCPYTEQLSGRHKVVFVDNDYFNYDHETHLRAVRELRPKYATVRDVMTEAQCREAGIQYYSLEQILEWAAELDEYAENVIVIPKYNCIDQIPEKYMLGYSVPTSHGGTPLPLELFRGRRVHLLGGSWRDQLRYMAALGDDVVSVDNNYIQRIASEFGNYILPDGETRQLADSGFGYLTNVRYAALALSFGAMGAKINELYQPVPTTPA